MLPITDVFCFKLFDPVSTLTVDVVVAVAVVVAVVAVVVAVVAVVAVAVVDGDLEEKVSYSGSWQPKLGNSLASCEWHSG